MYVCIYIHNHENNVTSRLSPQNHCDDNWEDALFSCFHDCIYITLASVRFEHTHTYYIGLIDR